MFDSFNQQVMLQVINIHIKCFAPNTQLLRRIGKREAVKRHKKANKQKYY